VDSIAVIIIKNKHIVVAGTGGSEEAARLVRVDLTGNPLVGNKDMVCACDVVGVGRVKVGHSGGKGFRRDGGTYRGKLGGAKVCALLVEVALDHGGGMRWMLADLAGGKFGKGCKMAGVEGLAPCGDSRGEERGMNKSDAVSKGSVGNKSVGCGRRLGRGKVKVPEAGGGCTSAGEE
jgi:hypothetical protein